MAANGFPFEEKCKSDFLPEICIVVLLNLLYYLFKPFPQQISFGLEMQMIPAGIASWQQQKDQLSMSNAKQVYSLTRFQLQLHLVMVQTVKPVEQADP